jgi:hypothetical protein
MSKNRKTTGAAGFALAGIVLVLGVACASGSGRTPGASKDSAVPGGEQTARPVSPGCGDRIDALPKASDGLAMTGEFPSRVGRGGDGTFTGSVTITTTLPRVAGVTSPEAGVYLAKAGEIVSVPLAQDLIGQPVELTPGAGHAFPARGAIQSCAAGGLLPAGGYTVFAMVLVNRDDGSVAVAAGGPWPLEVT